MNLLPIKMTRMAMLAVCSVALSAPFTVLAQDTATPPPPPPSGGQDGGPRGHMSPQDRDARQLEMLTRHLSLTPDQQAQIKQIFADSEAKMKAAHDSGAADKSEKRGMHAQMKASMEERQTKIRAVLTADQQKKYDEMIAKMKDHMGGQHGMGGPGGDNPPPPPPPPGL